MPKGYGHKYDCPHCGMSVTMASYAAIMWDEAEAKGDDETQYYIAHELSELLSRQAKATTGQYIRSLDAEAKSKYLSLFGDGELDGVDIG